jgi:hypothetical protein
MSETADQALSELEQATRDALAAVGPEQVLRVVQELTNAAERQLKTESLGAFLDEMDEIYGPVPQELLDRAAREWPDFEDD